MTSTLTSTTMSSPVGELTLVASDAGLRAVLWPTERDGRVTFDETIEDGDHPVLTAAKTQITEYLAGERSSFDLPLDLCLLYTSPSPRDLSTSRMPSSA